MNTENLYGIYELLSIETFKDAQKTTETAKAGMVTFTRDNKVSVVNGSKDWVMAYVGTFELKDNVLSIQVISCSVREMENTNIVRKVLVMDGNNLVLDITGSDTSKSAQISWKKTFKL